jgi:hypothetical protein
MLSVLITNSTSLLNADISHAVIEKVLLNFNFEQLNLLFQVLQIKTIRYSNKLKFATHQSAKWQKIETQTQLKIFLLKNASLR